MLNANFQQDETFIRPFKHIIKQILKVGQTVADPTIDNTHPYQSFRQKPRFVPYQSI